MCAGRCLARFRACCSRHAAVLLSACLLLCPTVAAADWHITPFLGAAFGGNTNLIDLEHAAGRPRLIYGGTVSRVGEGPIGFEGDFTYVPKFFQRRPGGIVTGSRVMTFMGNVAVALPLKITRESLRPYASGGFGIIRASEKHDLGVFELNTTFIGTNIGGGVVGFLTPFTGIRWEARYFRTVSVLGDADRLSFAYPRLSFWRGTMGVVIRY